MGFKIYKYLRSLSFMGIGMIIFCGMIFGALLLSKLTKSIDEIIISLILFLFPWLGLINFYYARRMIFSQIYIDEQGITNKLTTCKPIFIAWNECVEIGLGKMPMGYGLYNVGIYFSKESVPQKLRDEVQRIKLTDKCLWMQYDEVAMNEILKYVDESKITGYQLRPPVKTKRRSR